MSTDMKNAKKVKIFKKEDAESQEGGLSDVYQLLSMVSGFLAFLMKVKPTFLQQMLNDFLDQMGFMVMSLLLPILTHQWQI
jgi:hypothetical protein